MNIKLLLSKPVLNKRIKLIIEPLAPLSMVSELPGTYYKNQEVPDKFKLAGLFENVLGWQFDKKDREDIIKYLKKYFKKNFKESDFDIDKSNSSYQPLLLDYFEVGMVYKPETVSYEDLWQRSFSRMDADVHPKGTINIDYETLRKKDWIIREAKQQESIKEKIKTLNPNEDKDEINDLKEKINKTPLLKFFIDNRKFYPMFYTSPTLREYTDYMGGQIQISLTLDNRLLMELNKALDSCSSAYLGNSEGWIEIKIEEL